MPKRRLSPKLKPKVKAKIVPKSKITPRRAAIYSALIVGGIALAFILGLNLLAIAPGNGNGNGNNGVIPNNPTNPVKSDPYILTAMNIEQSIGNISDYNGSLPDLMAYDGTSMNWTFNTMGWLDFTFQLDGITTNMSKITDVEINFSLACNLTSDIVFNVTYVAENYTSSTPLIQQFHTNGLTTMQNYSVPLIPEFGYANTTNPGIVCQFNTAFEIQIQIPAELYPGLVGISMDHLWAIVAWIE